ncbi:multidrug efflux transporter, MFS family [Lachnospiraceae bacterium KM106-2]|nr:multidrug efflux transporter, MFS family [Lachnospiraceae bacterium KM106-2]
MKKNRVIVIFYIIAFLEMIGANLAHPITPTLIKNYNLPDYFFGVCFAGMAFTNFLFSPFWGKIGGRIGSYKVLFIGCLGYSVGQAMFAVFRSQEAILFARCFSGFFVSGISVCTLTYLVNQSKGESVGKNLALFASLTTIASALGFLIGGFLGEWSLFGTFMVQVAVLAGSGVLFRFLLLNDAETKTLSESNLTTKQIIKQSNPFQAFIDGKVLLQGKTSLIFGATLASFIASVEYDQCFNYYIKDQFGFSSAYNGLLKAMVAIISLVVNMTICIYIMKRFSIKKASVVVLACCSVNMLAIVLAGNIKSFLAVNIFYFALNAIFVPLLQALMAEFTPRYGSSMVMGFYNAVKSMGMVLGALLAGFAYEVTAKLPFVLSTVIFALGSILMFCNLQKKS